MHCQDALRTRPMIGSQPEREPRAVDPYKDLIHLPTPAARPPPLDTPLSDFSSKHRAKLLPPKPNGHHRGKADNLGRGLETAKRRALGHSTGLGYRPALLKCLL